MNRYEPSIPRTAFGIAAIALSAITLGLSVVLPASLIANRHDAGTVAAATVAAPAPNDVTLIPSRIDVSGNCDQKMAFEPVRRALPNADRSS